MTRDEAINLLDNLLGMVEDNHGSDYDMALRMAIDALKQPERITGRAVYQAGYADGYNSAQLERKTGKWIDQKGGGCCCSECGKYALDEPDGNFIHVSVKSNFCPNCGADMRGEEHDMG